MNKQWREGIKWGAISTVCVALCMGIVLEGGSAVVTIYRDHLNLLARIKQLNSDNAQLRSDLTNTRANAEQQCEQKKDKTINRLQKQLNAVCLNPDRRLTPMEQEQLFRQLKFVSDQMKSQKQPASFHMYGFTEDQDYGHTGTWW